jgi:RNA polymerase sigma-70 factor, ECF subfamily
MEPAHKQDSAAHAEMVLKVQQQRDMTAYRDLVQAHKERIYFLIRKFIRQHEDTEDLVQDTFVKSLSSIDRLQEPGRFGSWLSSIAVNLALDFKRRRANRGRVSINGEVTPEAISDDFIDKSGGVRPLTNLQEEEISGEISQALLQLPEKHREVFVSFHYEELSVREISGQMDTPEATVRSHLFRATQKLRKELTPYYKQYSE